MESHKHGGTGRPGTMHVARPEQINIGALNEDSLECIFSKISFDDRKDVLPLVCQRWNTVLQRASPGLWEQVIVEPGLSTSEAPSYHQTAKWLARRGAGVHHMRIRLFDYMSTSARRWSWLTGHVMSPARRAAVAAAAAAVREPAAAANPGATAANARPSRVHRIGDSSHLDQLPADTPLQAGFLAHVFPRYLTHLKTLYIMRSATVMNLADYRALGCLSRLEELTVINTQPTVDSARRAAPYSAQDFAFLGGLFSVRTLRLELDMKGFPNAICSLNTLDELQLKHLRDADVPEELAQLTRLTHLTLSDCGLAQVPSAICKLVGLRELSLAMNELTDELDDSNAGAGELFPAKLSRLTALTTLTLTCADLETVPEVLGTLTSLQELYLSGNRILASTHAFFMLPPTTSRLQSLRTLCLSCCKLEAAPLELCTLTALYTLNLSNNFIYDLPSTLHVLHLLQVLDLRRNRIHFMPSVLSTLTSLRSLDVAHNKLQYDETAVQVARLPRLDHFNFPSPNDAFQWDRVNGLGDPSGSTSTRYFAHMLAVLSLRAEPIPRVFDHLEDTRFANPPTHDPFQNSSAMPPSPRTRYELESNSDSSSGDDLELGLSRLSSVSFGSGDMSDLLADGSPHGSAPAPTQADSPLHFGRPPATTHAADLAAEDSEGPSEGTHGSTAEFAEGLSRQVVGSVEPPHGGSFFGLAVPGPETDDDAVMYDDSSRFEHSHSSSSMTGMDTCIADASLHGGGRRAWHMASERSNGIAACEAGGCTDAPTAHADASDSFAMHGGRLPRADVAVSLPRAALTCACGPGLAGPAVPAESLFVSPRATDTGTELSSVLSLPLDNLAQSPRSPLPRSCLAANPWELRGTKLLAIDGNDADEPAALALAEGSASVDADVASFDLDAYFQTHSVAP